MAMNTTQLAAEIGAAIQGVQPDIVLDAASLEALAGAIIAHIRNNAVVTTTVASGITVSVDPNTGTGSTTATGTGTGTID